MLLISGDAHSDHYEKPAEVMGVWAVCHIFRRILISCIEFIKLLIGSRACICDRSTGTCVSSPGTRRNR